MPVSIGVGTVTMKEIARRDVGGLSAEGELLGGGEFLGRDLEGLIVAGLKIGDAPGIDVEADDRKRAGHVDGQRQAHIAKANNGDPDVFGVGQTHALVHTPVEWRRALLTWQHRTDQLQSAPRPHSLQPPWREANKMRFVLPVGF